VLADAGKNKSASSNRFQFCGLYHMTEEIKFFLTVPPLSPIKQKGPKILPAAIQTRQKLIYL
jgi:hypothetical protein